MHRALSIPLLLLVLLLPLPFGASPDWAWAGMAAGVGVLLAAWGGWAAAGGAPVHGLRAGALWVAVPFALAALWALLQTLPVLPAALHHPLWPSLERAFGTAPAGAVSLDPETGRMRALRLAAYAGIFWLAFQCCHDRGRARRVLQAAAIGIGLYAAGGLLAEFSGARTILWFEQRSGFGSLRGTFVSRNAFATFLGFGLICATGLLWQGTREAAGREVTGAERRRRLLLYAAQGAWPLLAAWFAIAVALLLTTSRGGLLATVAGLAVLFALLLGRRGGSRVLAGVLLASVAAAGLLTFQLSGEGVNARLEYVDLSLEQRLIMYRMVLDAIANAPWTGTGAGTFEEVFRIHGVFKPGLVLARAHNDYLQLALELGVPAAAMLVGSLLALAAVCAAGALKRRRVPALPAIGCAVLALAGIHALVDFSLQTPAVPAALALITGAAAAQARSGGR